MERRFILNDFEQSLKDHADKFQMVPSKKVWHGIYNDLHPGKRWPSVTMSLLLIFTLVVIGHLNTNNSRQLTYLSKPGKLSETKIITTRAKRAGHSRHNQSAAVRKNSPDKYNEVAANSGAQSNSTSVENPPAEGNLAGSNLKTDQEPYNLTPTSNSDGSAPEKKFILSSLPNPGSGQNYIAENEYNKEYQPHINAGLDGIPNESLKDKIGGGNPDNQLSSTNTPLAKKILPAKKYNSNSNVLPADKNATDNISAKSIAGIKSKVARVHKKRNERVSWVYFAAPVLSSVSFTGEALKQPPSTNFLPGFPVNQKENKILHYSALGMEAGAQMNYRLTKKLKFTVGASLTYSGYHIISNIVHPTFANLVLRDPSTGMTYSRSFITHYGDGTGQSVITLRNYSWQGSIPLGLQYEFWGNNKMQLNIAGNVAPSLVLKSNSYILSTDGNNYVNDPSLLRKWNLNSNFGAFVTFRSSKFKWQLGPNIRYQWLSTYKRDHALKEHLIDYGIRLGISK